jgi:hypothetical protein
MQAQMGENPLLNEIDGIYYPVQNVYAPNGFKLSYKDIPHEVPKNIKAVLEHRMGSLDIEINAYRQLSEGDADHLLKNHEEVAHIAPAGLGPIFQDTRTMSTGKKAPSLMVKANQKLVAEYATHVRVLRDIERSSTKGSGVYMVLREGFVPAVNFKSQYKHILNTAPKDWDILFLRTGASKNVAVRCEDKIAGTNVYEMRRPVRSADGNTKFYQGIDGYVIRKQSISKVLKMLRHEKAGPLSELLMSVHTEEKNRLSNGKTEYKVDGIYSYMLTDSLLTQVMGPRPQAPKVQVKQDAKEEKQDDKKQEKKGKKSLLQTV